MAIYQDVMMTTYDFVYKLLLIYSLVDMTSQQ